MKAVIAAVGILAVLSAAPAGAAPTQLEKCISKARDLRSMSDHLHSVAEGMASADFANIARVNPGPMHDEFPFLAPGDLMTAFNTSASVIHMGGALARLMARLAGQYDALAAQLRECR